MGDTYQSHFPTRQVHCVSSAAIETNSTLADCLFYFTSSIMFVPSSYDIIISCISASIPYVWLNINESNNVFKVDYSGGSYTYTLPAGNYSITDILTVLGENIPELTFTYNSNTHKVLISHATENITIAVVLYSLCSYLGFTDFFSSTLTQTSFKPINLIRTTSIYVETPDLINESFDSRTHCSSGIVARIPVAGAPYSLISWTNIFGTHSKISLKQINHIRIRLLDDNRNIIDMRGALWTITLQFNAVPSTEYIEGEWLHSQKHT